jgi:hypothetical protein
VRGAYDVIMQELSELRGGGRNFRLNVLVLYHPTLCLVRLSFLLDAFLFWLPIMQLSISYIIYLDLYFSLAPAISSYPSDALMYFTLPPNL